MADRGRDLKVSILSDASRFDLNKAADQLEQVGDNASTMATDTRDATDELRRLALQGQDAQRQLDQLNAEARQNSLDQLGTDAKDTARKVDGSFDAIARSSRSASRKVDADTDRVGSSFRDVRDEANDTAREMGASFDGTVGSVLDGFQELSANAGIAFGPVGIAAGAAAAVGVGLIRDEAEKVKQIASDLVQEFVDAGGKLTESVIDAKVLQFATEDPQGFANEKKMIDDLGLSWKDYARAKAGDPAAADRITQQAADLNDQLTEQASAAGSASGQMYAQQTALNQLVGNISVATQAYQIAQAATNGYSDAMAGSATAAKKATDKASTAWDTLRSTYGEDIIGNLKVDSSQVLRDAQLAWAEADAYFRRHPIQLRTKGRTGQRPVRDVP